MGWGRLGRRIGAAVAAAAVLLLLGACSEEPAPQQADDASAADGHDHSHDVGEPTENFAFALGVPGDPGSADRTVEVKASKGFDFEPQSVDVEAGETVTFEVTNEDQIEHEFVLGNRRYQDLHDTQMKAGGVYHDYSRFSVHVEPGRTASVTWKFERAGRILFACHVPGHYDQGMIGRIEIT